MSSIMLHTSFFFVFVFVFVFFFDPHVYSFLPSILIRFRCRPFPLVPIAEYRFSFRPSWLIRTSQSHFVWGGIRPFFVPFSSLIRVCVFTFHDDFTFTFQRQTSNRVDPSLKHTRCRIIHSSQAIRLVRKRLKDLIMISNLVIYYENTVFINPIFDVVSKAVRSLQKQIKYTSNTVTKYQSKQNQQTFTKTYFIFLLVYIVWSWDDILFSSVVIFGISRKRFFAVSC